MATKHELDIEIDANGKIHVHVMGAKGKQCLQYVELFNSIGKTSDQRTTSEFHEPEPTTSIVDRVRARFKG
ncbi:MAG TPA: DUF2997 domain-containing protein [Armatimonadota bacterium]|jgi:hypothetical protein